MLTVAMIALRPTSWAFTILSCVLALFVPALARHFHQTRFSFSLLNLCQITLVAALFVSAAKLFVHEIHSQERMLQLWGNVDPDSWDRPSVRSIVTYTPETTLLLKLLQESFPPIIITLVFSIGIDWIRQRKSVVTQVASSPPPSE
ncbi:MAG: hypothetical protein AAF664_18750 [Planctomycetota bacterium]